MSNTIEKAEQELNSPLLQKRKDALQVIAEAYKNGVIEFGKNEEVNNHVHTMFSFSPYSPAGAVYGAKKAGLQAVGLMDHDSIAGGNEFLEAASLLGIGSTTGFEIRVSFKDTPFGDHRLNNPDSMGIAYMAVHGIPQKNFAKAQKFLSPVREARNNRNRVQVDKLNILMKEWGLSRIDFEKDVYGISQAAAGGSITERHILFAAAEKITATFGRGKNVAEFLKSAAKVELSDKAERHLSDPDNPHYLYDLLGTLKINVLPRFFIQPNEEECLPVKAVVDFALQIKGIPTYSYLGDVGESPTGDKKAQKFEDSYIEQLFPVLKELGFKAVTYMPPRNTKEQLSRVISLCGMYGLMQISGVDINSSRQSFSCPEVLQDMFKHLNDSTWALIAHEKLTQYRDDYSLLDGNNSFSQLPLEERIKKYSGFGRILDLHKPVPGKEILMEFTNG